MLGKYDFIILVDLKDALTVRDLDMLEAEVSNISQCTKLRYNPPTKECNGAIFIIGPDSAEIKEVIGNYIQTFMTNKDTSNQIKNISLEERLLKLEQTLDTIILELKFRSII